MAKKIDTLTVKITAEDVQPSLIKAMGMTKSELIAWREVMTVHGHRYRVEQIQKYIDILDKLEEDS